MRAITDGEWLALLGGDLDHDDLDPDIRPRCARCEERFALESLEERDGELMCVRCAALPQPVEAEETAPEGCTWCGRSAAEAGVVVSDRLLGDVCADCGHAAYEAAHAVQMDATEDLMRAWVAGNGPTGSDPDAERV